MPLPETESRRNDIVGFALIVAVMLLIAAGQLFVFADLETLYLGLPFWVWAQLVLLSLLLGLAWLATGFVTRPGGG